MMYNAKQNNKDIEAAYQVVQNAMMEYINFAQDRFLATINKGGNKDSTSLTVLAKTGNDAIEQHYNFGTWNRINAMI